MKMDATSSLNPNIQIWGQKPRDPNATTVHIWIQSLCSCDQGWRQGIEIPLMHTLNQSRLSLSCQSWPFTAFLQHQIIYHNQTFQKKVTYHCDKNYLKGLTKSLRIMYLTCDFLGWPMSHPLTQRRPPYDLHCSQPPGGLIAPWWGFSVLSCHLSLYTVYDDHRTVLLLYEEK